MKECLLIGGSADGQRIVLEHPEPEIRFPVPPKFDPNDPFNFDKAVFPKDEVYKRECLADRYRDFHVYYHDDGKSNLIEKLIEGYNPK